MIQNKVVITVENFEKMPMPIILDVKRGKVERVKLPVEI
jgi:hypothetical protein